MVTMLAVGAVATALIRNPLSASTIHEAVPKRTRTRERRTQPSVRARLPACRSLTRLLIQDYMPWYQVGGLDVGHLLLGTLARDLHLL